jgi:hypothetical protein
MNRIPVNADLLTFDPQLKEFEKLIHAAVQARQVLVPVKSLSDSPQRIQGPVSVPGVRSCSFLSRKGWCTIQPKSNAI